MNSSAQYDMNKQDWKEWIWQSLLFSVPAALAFLTALQAGQSLTFAAGAGYSALLAAAINLLRKALSGQPNQPTTPLIYQATTSEPTVEPTIQPSSEPAQ